MKISSMIINMCLDYRVSVHFLLRLGGRLKDSTCRQRSSRLPYRESEVFSALAYSKE